MTELRLSLKTKWFEMTKAGIKTEDYRSVNEYWCNRFILVNGYVKPTKWWVEKFKYESSISNIKWINDNILIGNFLLKPFTHNTMTLGYPKAGDSSRILKLEHKGIEIRTGNPELGAEPNKLYFVIKHGKIL